MVRGEHVDPRRGRLAVGAWAESWMASRVHLKPKTLASYESLLRTRIRPRWATVSLADVTNAEVAAWVASMRSEGLSASRVRQAYHLLSTMLDAAVRDRRLPSNPRRASTCPGCHVRNAVTSITTKWPDWPKRAGRTSRLCLSSLIAGCAGVKPPRCGCAVWTRCGAVSRSPSR